MSERIDGLKFKPYQMQCMQTLSLMDGYHCVEEWLNRKILLDLLVPYLELVADDSSKEMLDRLKDDGFGR